MREPNAAGDRKRKAPGQARLETSSGGVVFRLQHDGPEFLLIKDPYDNWGLPKGHVEGGETPVEAAIREVTEETGLCELHVVEQLPTIDWYFRDRGRLVHKFCHFFLLQCTGGEARPQVEDGCDERIGQLHRVMVRTRGEGGDGAHPAISRSSRHPFHDRAVREPEMPRGLPCAPTGADKTHRLHADMGQVGIKRVGHVHDGRWFQAIEPLRTIDKI